METVSDEKVISCFKNFQNSLLQSNKVVLDSEAKFKDVYDSSNLNRIKELEVIAFSYANAQRESSNTMQLVEVFETSGGKDCMGAGMTALIKTENNLISRLHNINY